MSSRIVEVSMSRIKGPSKRKFDEIFQRGRRIKGDFFTLIVRDGVGFVGIATSKKIGEKPSRNFQKRRIRSILQQFQRTATHDLIVIANSRVNSADFETIHAELTQLLSGIDIGWERK
jgi:ribonuclease P protein component